MTPRFCVRELKLKQGQRFLLVAVTTRHIIASVQLQEHEKALHGIAVFIQSNPDTLEGVQLRKFLWALYDPQVLISLHRLYTRVDPTRLMWVRAVQSAAAKGTLKKGDLSRALLVAGEFQRQDSVRVSSESIRRFVEAEAQIKQLAGVFPPCQTLQDLGQLLFECEDVKRRMLSTAHPDDCPF